MKTLLQNRLLTPSVAAMVLGLLPMGASAGYRTFTSADGRTIDAELIAATDSKVTMKMKSKSKPVEFSISLLTEEDQKFVRQWAKENASYNLKIEAKKKMTGSENTKEGNKKTNVRSYVYDVSILNWGRTDLKDATVKYRIFTAKDTYNEGSYKLYELARGATSAFQSDGVTLQRCETTTKTGG